jgi:hypothetical protein
MKNDDLFPLTAAEMDALSRREVKELGETIRAAMKPVAEIMEEIGWDKRLAELTEAQVLTLIEVAIDGFQTAMRARASITSEEVPF